MIRPRRFINVDQLSDFEEWLKNNGWNLEPPKGRYEVMRARNKNGEMIMLYLRMNAEHHYSTFGLGNMAVEEFLESILSENAHKKQAPNTNHAPEVAP